MSVFHELFQKAHYLTKGINNVLKTYGLYSAQFQILLCLDEYGAMKLAQFRKYMNVWSLNKMGDFLIIHKI